MYSPSSDAQTPHVDLSNYRSFIAELAVSSSAFIRPFFAQPDLVVETKADDSPVTAADRGAEKLLRQLIGKRFPTHGIIGEEFGNENAGADFVWVLDPIDGTKSFAAACPLFGTLIALLHEGEAVLGVINLPALEQLYLGDNTTTTLNGRPVRSRATTQLAHATLLTSDTVNLAKYQNGAACDRVVNHAKLFRTWGDCYGYTLVAGGWADVMLDPIMNPWDIAALVPVIRGAGGVITDWQGKNPVSATSTVAAATAQLHAEVIQLLNT